MGNLYTWESKFELCYYSKRLLNKLILLNQNYKEKIDLLEIKKAIFYAKKYHGDQKRESGEPYYSHPLEVAYMAADYIFKTDLLITCILHDTLEDTCLTKDLISNMFNPNIAEQVENLTRIKIDKKISSAEMLESLWLQNKNDLLLIKQFDRLHNIYTLNYKANDKKKKIAEETIDAFIILALYLETPSIAEELLKYCVPIIDKNKLYFNLINNRCNYNEYFILPSLISKNFN